MGRKNKRKQQLAAAATNKKICLNGEVHCFLYLFIFYKIFGIDLSNACPYLGLTAKVTNYINTALQRQ